MRAKSQKKTKPVEKSKAAQTAAKRQSSQHTINFFCHFQPDGELNTELQNAAMVWGFYTGGNKLFPLHLPFLEALSDAAFAGDQSAANILVQIATHLAFRIAMLEKQQPNLMREIARKQNVWPIFTDTHTGWEKEVLTRFAELSLGQDIRHIDIRFRKAGGCDENYPARRWAKAAVHCVTVTRHLQLQLASRKDIVNKKLEGGTWKRGVEPAWVSETKCLPDYSNQSRPKWADVIRKMIREESPDFHLRPEWKNQRNNCEANSRSTKGATKGEIQNAILDDIISALKTITPGELNQSAENPLPNFSTHLKG